MGIVRTKAVQGARLCLTAGMVGVSLAVCKALAFKFVVHYKRRPGQVVRRWSTTEMATDDKGPAVAVSLDGVNITPSGGCEGETASRKSTEASISLNTENEVCSKRTDDLCDQRDQQSHRHARGGAGQGKSGVMEERMVQDSGELVEAMMTAEALRSENQRLERELFAARQEMEAIRKEQAVARAKSEQLERDLERLTASSSHHQAVVDQFHPRVFKPIAVPPPTGDAASTTSLGGLSSASEPVHMATRRAMGGGWSLLRSLSREGRREGSLPPTPLAPRRPVCADEVLQLFNSFTGH